MRATQGKETRQHIVLSNIPKRPQLMMRRVELESLALIPWVSIPLLPSKMRTATVAQSTDLFLAGRFAHAWAFRGTSSLSHSALHSGCLKPVSLSWFFLRSTSPVIASVSGTCVYNKLPHSVVVQFAVTKARLARNIDIYFDSYSAPRETGSADCVAHSLDYYKAVRVA